MTDPTIDPNPDDPGQQNPISNDWYADLAPEESHETLSKFESFDAFLADYNSAKNADWRDGIAGDDDKFKSTLERFADPQAFGNAYREAQQKIRSGQLRPELPSDATEDQIKEFRAANGIPEEVTGYLDDLPDGLVVGEDDKELMLDFLGSLHNANADPSIAHAAIEWYNDFEERQQNAIADLDTEQSQEATDALREAWGKDFRGNMNVIKGMLDTYFGEEASEQLMNGRYMDGRGFFNDVNVLKGLAELGRKVNDFAPMIEQDPAQLKSLHDEIADLEKMMGDRRSEYWKGPSAEANQARLRELYDVRSKLTQDNAA